MNSLTINDRIYGTYIITENILIDLIHSPSIQRLKYISQYGVPDQFYHFKNYSRYEHSLGVMLLLRKLGAPVKEQVAGLLHDVSHTSFSHIIDWVLSNGPTSEDYQDSQHEKFIKSSELPKILTQYHYSVDEIIDYHNFPLLERESPDICADRIDYSLREFKSEEVLKYKNIFTVFENKIVLIDKESAYLFGTSFLQRQIDHWGNDEGNIRWYVFSNLLKYCLKQKIVSIKDFWKSEDYIVRTLTASNDEVVRKFLALLRKRSLSIMPRTSVIVYKKFRFVDPEYIASGKLYRLSKTDSNFKSQIKKALKANKKGVRMIQLPL